MKKVYTVYSQESKDVHVPSTDYYARNNESQTDSMLEFVEQFQADTEAECEAHIAEIFQNHDHFNNNLSKTTFIIVPTYTLK